MIKYTKYKPLEINVTNFLRNNKPITLKQLEKIQKQVVTNMVVQGINGDSIYEFVKESNKIKRHLGKETLSKIGRKRILSLLNVGSVNSSLNKSVLKIKKPKITKVSKIVDGDIISNDIIKKLEKRGLIAPRVKSLINYRKTKKVRWVSEHEIDDTILESIDAMYKSNPVKYFPDIQRMCFDYLGIWFETLEDFEKWWNRLR